MLRKFTSSLLLVSWFNSSPCRLQLYESHLFSNLQSFSVTLLECLHARLTSRRIRHVDCTARQREAERETASKIYLTHRTLNRWAPDSIMMMLLPQNRNREYMSSSR
uniref:Uncharacterized protein n=1 Tax=Mola mola TaxID=94237 RepID=A0A3Q3WL47_MOLML